VDGRRRSWAIASFNPGVWLDSRGVGPHGGSRDSLVAARRLSQRRWVDCTTTIPSLDYSRCGYVRKENDCWKRGCGGCLGNRLVATDCRGHLGGTPAERRTMPFGNKGFTEREYCWTYPGLAHLAHYQERR
jgi:hypothetical protein